MSGSYDDLKHAAAGGRTAAHLSAAHTHRPHSLQTGYFVSLAALLKEEGKPDDIRQLAGLMIKNALDAEVRVARARYSSSAPRRCAQIVCVCAVPPFCCAEQDSIIQRRKHQRWSELPDGVKVGVRNDLVAALAASSEGTRHGAAQAIAKAGAIDVPAGAWPDLLPGLLSAVSNAGLADGIKAATLRALGYLLEELGLEAVGQSVVNQILTAIVDGMATGRAQEVRREAGRALEHALDFASENFSDAHVGERNAIMSAICNATQSDDAVTRSGAYACVTRVAELYYDQIGMYMDTLAQLTFAAARGKQEDTAVLAVEFWDVIADEESDRGDDASNKKYIAAALTPLTDLLLELMCKQEEDEDDESYSTAQAAGVCLTSVSHAVGDTVLSVVMPFVQKGFSSADWHVRDAATLAFGIMCGTGSSEAITPLITQALPPLIQRLVAGAPTFDASAPVRDTTAWVVGHIMETCFDDLGMSDETFGRLVNVLHAALDDEARVAQNVAFALECIGFKMEGAEGEDGKTQLSPHLMTVIGHLLTRADKEDRNERNLRTACYAAIMAIVENAGSADEALLLQLLMEAGRRLQSAFARPPAASADDREELQSLVTQTAALIQTLVIALGGSVKPAADALVPLLLRVFDSRCTPAYQEAYRALGAVSAGVGEGFVAFMPLVFPVVMEGLKLVEDAQTCCAAVYALSEITTALEGAFDPYVADAVGVLLRNVSMVEVQRSVKPPSLSVFGDVAMGVGSAAFSPHVQSVMQILDMAAATVNPNKVCVCVCVCVSEREIERRRRVRLPSCMIL